MRRLSDHSHPPCRKLFESSLQMYQVARYHLKCTLAARSQSPMRISAILERIDENQLFVPAFQREYVWKREDAKELIDSLIKEYPTGTMLTWETANPPELKGPHKYNQKQGAVRLLLDGQQRVTTLYMLVHGKIPPYYTAAE